jgi:hypothetical protein
MEMQIAPRDTSPETTFAALAIKFGLESYAVRKLSSYTICSNFLDFGGRSLISTQNHGCWGGGGVREKY